jgi:outer membrane immunogenic protein
LKRLLLASAALGILVAPAAAADMYVKAPPPYPYVWNGFYGGVNVGYADEQSTFTSAANPVPDTTVGFPPGSGVSQGLAELSSGRITTSNGMGVIGGGQVGYNLQLNKVWVVGLEADIQGKTGSSNGTLAAGATIPAGGVSVTSVQTVSASTDWIGTVRGRLGVLLAPNWLVYFTGGLAYGGNSASATLNQSGNNGFLGVGAGSFSGTRIGGTFGGGVEWMFARNWSAKVEYLFYDLGTASFAYSAQAGGTFVPATPTYQNLSNTVHFEGNIARVGVNYHF